MEPQERKKTDWYLWTAWLLVIVMCIAIATYFYIHNVNSCTAQPFEYGVKVIKEQFDVEIVYGSVFMMDKDGVGDRLEFGDVNFTKTNS